MRIAEQVTFGGTGRDRGHELRRDPDALAALLAEGRVLPLWRCMVLAGEDALGWLQVGDPMLEDAPQPVFLGLWQGKGVFAADISHWSPEQGVPDQGGFDAGMQPHPLAPEGHALTELRRIMAALSPDEAEMAATARALLEWHRTHGFCAACGAASQAGGGGWHRKCPACHAMHFPRTDPVVIMLVTRANRLLLGRSPGWPEGMYSTLAGFVEPGETVEAAVRREVHEETGISCGAVRYLASQPWPFPASLMLGCHAEAMSESITLDPAELEDALWLTREEMVAVLSDDHPAVRPPRQGSIARFLITNWLADRLD
ncbi:NAD(+) diphosphatase [Pseudogemmobacter humi]|uniref:NAD(+) diphosphatase n=1 Tax=Pseudogemmobacter humi TaxID=2483812 RepID=A0A3P5X1J8_9RHOB|nr:NAD(+) diphosphatase [Pseudogemmobacter humi]VDC25190.1 NADH pyrophosphatase [Pseudogemmobacter humi]